MNLEEFNEKILVPSVKNLLGEHGYRVWQIALEGGIDLDRAAYIAFVARDASAGEK